jgi:hypothetical protein
MRLRVCLVSYFTQKILGFGPSFCRMELNTMQIFWQKVSFLYFGFWPQETKKAKKLKSPHPHHGKFGILDGTKHTHENFGILHFIISK